MTRENLRKNLPLKMQLQFFAEGNDPAELANDPAPSAPNPDDMVAEIARLRAENATLKNASDKNSKEAADYKRRLHERMTAEEKLSEEQQAAKEAHEQEFNNMKQRLAIIDAERQYMRLEMDMETANKAAVAAVGGDTDALYSILEDHIKAVKEKAKQEFLVSRPDIASGSGSADPADMSVEVAKNIARRRTGGLDLSALANYR